MLIRIDWIESATTDCVIRHEYLFIYQTEKSACCLYSKVADRTSPPPPSRAIELKRRRFASRDLTLIVGDWVIRSSDWLFTIMWHHEVIIRWSSRIIHLLTKYLSKFNKSHCNDWCDAQLQSSSSSWSIWLVSMITSWSREVNSDPPVYFLSPSWTLTPTTCFLL